jgi:hypothetical protein
MSNENWFVTGASRGFGRVWADAALKRVDTVHQGDLDGTKGLYHINAVDEVTQWQVVGATAQISEAWLMPVLVAMLAQFPFRIRGFHSDNGSEFISHTVAQMLNKLLVEQTKSRPRHSNDNGLAETKNGWVIRKHIGYGHIASGNAEAFDEFYRQHFNPYLNFHRPCGVPEITTNAKGKQKRVYRWYATSWEILQQLPGLAGFLRAEVTVDQLQQTAGAKSDTWGRHGNARSETQVIRPFAVQEERVKMKPEGPWK